MASWNGDRRTWVIRKGSLMKIPRRLLNVIRRPVLDHIVNYPPTRIIENLAGAPYLKRWELRRNHPSFDIYLHQFLRSDDNRALHDHTAASIGIIVCGRYTEWLQGNRRETRTEGDVIVRRAMTAHRIEINEAEPAPITIFLRGRKTRDWGFYCPSGWRHHRDFHLRGCEP